MLSLYRRLIDLRRSSAALSVGSYRQLYVTDDLLFYSREYGERSVAVALNFSNSARSLAALARGGRRIVLSTYLDAGEPGVLRPDEGLILE
jgi:alpha-glucosidase